MVDAAARADVVFHSLNPSILPAEDSMNLRSMQSSFVRASERSTWDSNMLGLADRAFLNFVAEETGGTASYFRHNLREGMDEAEEQSRYYYTLAFPIRPDDGDRIDVEVRPRKADVTVAWAPRELSLPTMANTTEIGRQIQIADALEIGNDATAMAFELLAQRVPSREGYGRLAVVAEIPTAQLRDLVVERGDDKVELEIMGLALAPWGEVVDHFRGRIDLEDAGERLANVSVPLRYQNLLAVPPGKYFLKFVVRDTQVSKLASRSLRLEIPETEDPDFAVSSPLVIAQGAEGFLVRGVDPDNPPEYRAELPLEYPFAMGGQELVPAVVPSATAGQDIDIFVSVYAPTPHPFTGQNVLTAESWLQADDGTRLRSVRPIRQLFTEDDAEANETRLALRLSLAPNLPSGRYALVVQVYDGIANQATQAWSDLIVESMFSQTR